MQTIIDDSQSLGRVAASLLGNARDGTQHIPLAELASVRNGSFSIERMPSDNIDQIRSFVGDFPADGWLRVIDQPKILRADQDWQAALPRITSAELLNLDDNKVSLHIRLRNGRWDCVRITEFEDFPNGALPGLLTRSSYQACAPLAGTVTYTVLWTLLDLNNPSLPSTYHPTAYRLSALNPSV